MDDARKQTDIRLKKMIDKLHSIYAAAQEDINYEWRKYMDSIKPRANELFKAYEDAKKTGDADLIKQTGKDYGRFLREQTLTNNRFKDMLDETTTQLSNVNQTALSYLNGTLPETYAINYNQAAKDINVPGYSFSLTDANTVKNLATTNKSLLPTKTLNIPKDKRWNTKSLTSQILQGIVGGDSIGKLANRLQHISDMNENAAIRNARTMTTSAENKGRLDSYKKAQSDGLILKKVWLAAIDERTRDWHAELDGVMAEVDEPFENSIGPIMYPGDPHADGANVYNCRCTLITKVLGFRRSDGTISYIENP